ncbi:RNHCP domain-containing protein [Verrucomicrobiota bacterium]
MTRPQRTQTRARGPGPAFQCEHCGEVVSGTAPGTENRNHCPRCLWSLHVDLQVGDRRSGCRGLMEPISVWVMGNGEWRIVHRCRKCGMMRANRVAGDDNELLLMSMATRPLARPPFPLHRLGADALRGV